MVFANTTLAGRGVGGKKGAVKGRANCDTTAAPTHVI